MSEDRVLTVAHRFGNDLGRLAEAEAAGIDRIEADVWLYRGRLEVRHLKTMGPIPLLWDRWRLASASVPRLLLCELVDAASHSTPLFLDLKGRERTLAAHVLHELERLPEAARYTVASQGWDHLDAFRDDPRGEVIHSVGSRSMLARYRALPASRLGDAVGMHQKLLTPDVVREMRHRVGRVLTWTVNDIGTAEILMGWGINGIISDRLDVLQAVKRGTS